MESAKRLTVDLAAADRFTQERQSRDTLGDQFIFLDDRKRGSNLPLRLCSLTRVKQQVCEDQVDGGHVGVHANGSEFLLRPAIGGDGIRDLALRAEEIADSPMQLSQRDVISETAK